MKFKIIFPLATLLSVITYKYGTALLQCREYVWVTHEFAVCGPGWSMCVTCNFYYCTRELPTGI